MNKPIYNSQQILTNQQLADQIRSGFIGILEADITRYQATRTYRRYAKKANHPRVVDVTWLADKINANIAVSALISDLLIFLNSGEHFKYFAKLCSVRRDFLRHIAEFKDQYAAALPLIEGNLENLIFNDPAQAGPPGPRLEQQPVPAEQLLHNPILASALNEIENQKRVIRDLQTTVEQQQATIQQQSSRIERLITKLSEILKNGISFLREVITYKKTRLKQDAFETLLKETEKEVADLPAYKELKPSHLVINNALREAVAHVEPQAHAPQLSAAAAMPPPAAAPPAAAQVPQPPAAPPIAEQALPPSAAAEAAPAPPAAPAFIPPSTPSAVQQQTNVVNTRARAQTIPAPTTVNKKTESDPGLDLAMCSALRNLRKVPDGQRKFIIAVDQPNTEPTITTPIAPPIAKRFEVSKPATAVARTNTAPPPQNSHIDTAIPAPPSSTENSTESTSAPPPPPPAPAPTPVISRIAPTQTPAQPILKQVDVENVNAKAEDESLDPKMVSALKSLKKVKVNDKPKPVGVSPPDIAKALAKKFAKAAPPKTPLKPSVEEQINHNDTFEV